MSLAARGIDDDDDDRADSARLTVQHGFGLRAGVRDGVGFVNDQCLFYLVGRYVAQYETQSQLQTFVYEQPASVKDISAAAISPNGKYLAVCEVLAHGKGTCSQLIVIFLPTRRAMRTLEHTVDGTVTCATFSHDSKLVACQLSGPENLCTVWHWEKAKQLGSFKSRTPVSRVRFNPEQAAMLSVSAPMRIVKANEKGNFKEVDVPALRKLAASEVQEHLWLSGSRLLVLTGDGLAHMFVSGEYSYASRWWHQPAPSTLIGAGEFALHAEEEEGEEGSEAHGRHSDWRPADGAVDPAAIAQASAVSEAPTVAATVVARPRSAQAAPRTPQTPAAAAHASPNCQITCASATAQGVLLGTSDGSALMLVEGAPGSRLRLAAAVRSDARQHSVLSIAISPSESDCLLLFGDHQLGMCSLRAALRKLGLEGNTSAAVGGGRGLGGDGAGLSAAAGDGAGGEEARAPMEFGYELLFQSIARGAISGLAAAASKPLFASCAEDGTVRVHSYTAPHATLITYTPEDGAPHSLALHPLGVQLALVQKDRVNLLDVGIDALWPSRELHADQASRAVYSTGGSYIAVACGSMLRVFSAYSGAPVAKMAGHTGPISAISWAANDLVLASAGADGMTYRWALSDGARLEEHHAKGNSYSAVALVSGVRMPHGRAEEGGHVDARTDRRNGDGSGDGLLEHELKGKDSHGLVDARRHSALVAVGTDSKLRLLCNGDVTELVVLQAASGGEGAAAGPGAGSSVVAGTASPPSTAGSGRPVNAAAASLSTQPAVGDGSSGASLVRFTCVAALHAHPIIFAGTLSGAIHVFSIEGRARDSSGGVGGAPGGADARSERRADGAQPAIGGGHGGQVRLSSSLVVPAAQRAGGAVAVLVAGSAGARAWQAHHGKVTRMAVTMDDCYLMSGSEDGSVFVFSVSLLCRGFDFGAQPVPLASLSLSDVVSVSRRTLDDLRTQLAETSLAAAERTLNVEAAVARETAAWREKADVKERAHAAAIARLERLIAEGQAARTAEALAFAKRMSAQAQVLDNKGREATSHLEGVLKLEIEATHALTAQLEAERKEAALQVQALQSQLAAERAAAADAAAAHRAALARAQAASAERADALLHAAEESTAMMEEEHDSEVARLRREAEDKQAVLHGEATQLRVERMVDRNQMKKGREKERALEAAVAENAAALSAAYAKIDGLERQLAAMHLAVEERERGLGERDTAYHQLSETATKLANSRDMLDSRIKELEAAERSSEVERRELRGRADAMLEELKEESRKREQADKTLLFRQGAYEAAAAQARAATKRCSAYEHRLFVLADELKRVVSKSSRSWDEVERLLKAHAAAPAPQHPPHFEAMALTETKRQRRHAEEEAQKLRERVAAARRERNGVLRAQFADNTDLLSDLNLYKRENYRLKRALDKAKAMVIQHVAARAAGEVAIERASLLETLGLSDGEGDVEDDGEDGEDDSAYQKERRIQLDASRLTEQELELRALREQVSFFLTQPMARSPASGSALSDQVHASTGHSQESSAAKRRAAVKGLMRGPASQPNVRWEQSGNTVLRKTVPLPPV